MKQTRFMASILIAAVLIAAALGVLQVMPGQVQAQGEYNTNCHMEQGGSKAVGGPGCEYEFQPGSVVDVQSGIYNGYAASVTISESLVVTGSATLGGNLILQNGETIDNSQNDMITVTTAATGFVNVKTGNLKVGNGVPGNTQDGEDTYLEGILEVDGPAYFDGGAYCTSFTLANGETIDNSQNDMITMTTAATGFVSISTGNFKVGNGNPGTAQDGEDAYVEGGLEVDGVTKLDGAVNIAGVETVTGRRVAATWDNTTLQTVLVITNDTEIVPTGSLQPIWVATGTAGVGTGSITTTGMTVGNRLVLINVGTPPIGITDTGVFSLSGNIAMTRDDTLELLYIGGGWVEITHAAN